MSQSSKCPKIRSSNQPPLKKLHQLISSLKRMLFIRFCVDFRRLNTLAKEDAYSTPRMDYFIDSHGDSTVILTLSVDREYWQVGGDRRRRQVKNRLPIPPRPISIYTNAFWTQECARHIPMSHGCDICPCEVANRFVMPA